MKVSVIVPVYNVEKYLKKCLDSIINQTYKDLEIIIVNDGSNDNSHKIINKYLKKDKRIKYFYKENGGLSSARNYGIEKSTGDFIAFIDSDDYINLNMIELMVNKMVLENSDVCICDIIDESEDGTINSILKGVNFNDITIENVLLSLPSACNKIFKKDILNIEFPKDKYYEDLGTIQIILSNCSSISYLNKPLYHYIQRSGSIMHQKKYNKKLEDIFYILERLYTNNSLKAKYEEELEFMYIKYLLHDASLRFLSFDCKEAKDSLNKIVAIIKEKFPKWRKNKYINLFSKKELLLTNIIYKKYYILYKLYRKVISKS